MLQQSTEIEHRKSSWKYSLADSLGIREYLLKKLAFRPPSPIGYSFNQVENAPGEYHFTPRIKCQNYVNSSIRSQAFMLKRKNGGIRQHLREKVTASLNLTQGASRSKSWQEQQKIGANRGNLYRTELEEFQSRILVLYSHGNASDLGDVYFFGEAISMEYDVDFLGYDYSGYGLSKNSHTPSEKSAYEDLQSVLAFAVYGLGYSLEQIVLWGYSLGSGPTCEIASRFTSVGAVVLQAPIASLYHWVDDSPPYLDGFANFKKVHSILSNILIIHGTGDTIVPFRHSELLFNSYNQKVSGTKRIQFVKIPGAGHHDMHEQVLDSLGEVGYQIKRLFRQIELQIQGTFFSREKISEKDQFRKTQRNDWQAREMQLLRLIDDDVDHPRKENVVLVETKQPPIYESLLPQLPDKKPQSLEEKSSAQKQRSMTPRQKPQQQYSFLKLFMCAGDESL